MTDHQEYQALKKPLQPLEGKILAGDAAKKSESLREMAIITHEFTKSLVQQHEKALFREMVGQGQCVPVVETVEDFGRLIREASERLMEAERGGGVGDRLAIIHPHRMDWYTRKEAFEPLNTYIGDVTPYKGEIGRIKILGYMTRIIVSTFGRKNEEYLMNEALMHPKWPEGGGQI